MAAPGRPPHRRSRGGRPRIQSQGCQVSSAQPRWYSCARKWSCDCAAVNALCTAVAYAPARSVPRRRRMHAGEWGGVGSGGWVRARGTFSLTWPATRLCTRGGILLFCVWYFVQSCPLPSDPAAASPRPALPDLWHVCKVLVVGLLGPQVN